MKTTSAFKKRFNARGFSLAESLISIGIASSVLLAVVGLLAGTISGARDSRQETVAGMIAGQISNEMRQWSDAGRSIGAANHASEIVVVLDDAMQILQHSVRPSDRGVVSDYAGGSRDLRAAWIARAQRVALPASQDPLMDQMVVTVESPASAPRISRKVSRYVSLVPKL
jgi:type II secretory pathway pseudopilin PulG